MVCMDKSKIELCGQSNSRHVWDSYSCMVVMLWFGVALLPPGLGILPHVSSLVAAIFYTYAVIS